MLTIALFQTLMNAPRQATVATATQTAGSLATSKTIVTSSQVLEI